MRHAKSRWDEPVADHDRGLSPRGLRDAPAMGAWLATQGIRPDITVSSTANRAATTARLACEAAGFEPPAMDDRLYGAGVRDVQAVVDELAGDVMVVGHNPTMEMALGAWVDDLPRPADGKLMPTAAAAIIDPDARRLVAWQRPRDLSQ